MVTYHYELFNAKQEKRSSIKFILIKIILIKIKDLKNKILRIRDTILSLAK